MKSVFIFLVSMLPSLANADVVMAPEKSRCLALEGDGRDVRAYQSDYHRFLTDYDTLAPKMRFEVMVAALTKNVKLLKKTAGDAHIPLDPMTDIKLILDIGLAVQQPDYKNLTIMGISPKESERHMLDSLVQFESAILVKLVQAQANRPECMILQDPQ